MKKIVSNGDRDCTVILDGTECSVKFDRCFLAYSVQNNSTSDVFVSIHQGANAGDDGVVRIKAGSSGVYAHMRTEVKTVYFNGTGEIQVHGQNDTNNSFRNAPVSGGGGTTVDSYSKTESDARYAQKSEIPTALPANGGNADTVGGKTIDSFIYPNGYYTDNVYDIKRPFCGVVTNTNAGVPVENGPWGTIICFAGGTGSWVQMWISSVNNDQMISTFYIRHFNGDIWSKWGEISTTPIKSTIVSGTTDANSNLAIFPTADNKVLISGFYYNCICIPIVRSDGLLCMHMTAIDGANMANTTIPSMEVFYFER